MEGSLGAPALNIEPPRRVSPRGGPRGRRAWAPRGAAVAFGVAFGVVLAGCSSGPAPVFYGGKPGQVVVRPGDSLYLIARRHGVGLRALIDANRAVPPYVIHPGEVLRLPAGRARGVAAAPPGARKGVRAGRPAAGRPAGARAASLPRPGPRPPSRAPAPSATGSRFVWPVRGRVISRYGVIGKELYNDGINIGTPLGTSVRAAGGGVVAYTGNEIPGFGNLLLIRHGDGWVSAYAHNQANLVRQGERVRQGQVIARVGTSGNVSSPQLHFELRKNNRPVDPERYLRDRAAGSTARPAAVASSRGPPGGPPGALMAYAPTRP